jgi:transcriptional regulator with PAS, ATPase and Fis domain
VLIQGESGTGKELIARALHFNSKRKANPFVSENCAAISPNLMESEFFGYEKGAFTGADKKKLGLFEVANSSTLFLDEIAEMSPDMQTKFLRVIQEGEIRRVGGKETIKVDVRLVSACNKDLAVEIKKNKFREDLFYRLNVITIELPPLRKRKEDVPSLINFFLERDAAKNGGAKRELAPETMEVLFEYDWPGNIRELENEIERAMALSKDTITPDYLSEAILTGIKKDGSASFSKAYSSQTLKDIIQEETEKIERAVILKTLQESQWKKAEAAETLGISRPTLDSKIEKYKIRKEN